MKKQLLLFFAFIFSAYSFAQVITMQNGTLTACGSTFTDSGGESANYNNDEDFTLTLCPETSGDSVALNFSHFSTQFQVDVMTIYNGDSTNSPLIGSYSGGGTAQSPGSVIANNTTGCLTIHYSSNSTGTTIGWAAQINCIDSASFQMFPNCSGATATITGEPGGTFAFNPIPTDGTTIDPVTGTVTNATPGDTITVEYTTTNAGQQVSSTETFTVLSAPTANTPSDLEVCDTDGNGFADFNLDINNQEIIGNQDPNGFYVMHFLTPSDAAVEANPLSSPYSNTTNPQTIYAIIKSIDGDCVSNTITYNLIVNSLNISTQSYDIITCGDGQGVAGFDLTQFENQFTNGNSNLFVSYFETLGDANSNINAIANPTFYQNVNSPYNQIIYIRIEDPNTGCFYVSDNTVLYLNVNDTPANQPTPLVAEDPDNDGFAQFILEDKLNQIVGNLPAVIVTFHETQADADNNVNALSSPYTNIVANLQTVYVRVESATNNCTSFTTLDLVTEYVAFQVNSATIETCASTGNGSGTFDLTTADSDILSNVVASDYTIAYYQVYSDATNQANAIADPTTYTNPNLQTVYAGVTESTTGDYVITTIDLLISEMPIIDFNNAGVICDNNSIVLNPNSNPNSTFSWNTGEDTSTITINVGGFYEVTVIDNITGCTSTGSITILEYDTPILSTPNDLSACIDEVVDLNSQIVDLVQNPSNTGGSSYEINQYLTLSDAQNQTNQIINSDQYIATQSETIFIRVAPAEATCSTITSYNLVVTDCNGPTIVTCGQPYSSSFCYTNNNTQQLTYTSNDGSPLQIVISSGQVENIYDELIVLDTDGTTNLNTASPYGNEGDVSNLTFAASGDTITIYVNSDGSVDCVGNNYTTINYVVSCVDTSTIPNCDTILTTPQDLAVDVNETIDLSWTSASGYVTGYFLSVEDAEGQIVIDMVDVGSVTTYIGGTLNYDTQYFVTITPYNSNGNAVNCNTSSFTTRADPNVIVDCASGQPVNTNFCYDNNETLQYNFISNDSSSLYIVFNSGTTENNFDELIVLDSDGITNLNADYPYGLNDDGDLTGLTFTTSGTTATVYIESDGSVIGCTNDPIDFDVFCASNIGFIEVNAFLDDNNDGIFNGNDTPFTNGFFTYEINNDGSISTVNSNTGSFTIINQDEANNYDITFATNAGYENCFTIPTALFQNVTVLNGNTVTIDFPITEQMPCEDLSVYLIPFSSPRPGFNYWNDLVIENLGSTTITSGTIEFIHDTIVDYVDATPFSSQISVIPSTTGATVSFTNLLPGESRVVWFKLYAPPTLNLGEFVTSSVAYTTTTNDVVSENNVSVITQEVIGSYDPNDITELHGRDIVYDDFTASDEYLYYTIRFQNVGTAEAINVRIENTIDPLLDLSSLHFIRATHDVVMTQNANQLTWTFDTINLPAQSQDDYGSNGYVHYRIKPTAGYAIGTIIPNTAEIYFDFNAPVITNTFETEFVAESLSVDEFNTSDFTLYPNPTNTIVNIKLKNISNENASVEVIDILGKTVIRNTINETLQLNVKSLESGLYFVKLKQNNKQTIKKLIIE